MAKRKSRKGKGHQKASRGHKKASRGRGRRRGFKHSKATRAKIARALRAYHRALKGGHVLKTHRKSRKGKSRRKSSKGRKAHKKATRKQRHGSPPGRCMYCDATISGGLKGLATHARRRHPGHRPSATQKAVARHHRKSARRRRRAQPIAISPAKPSGFTPELRARLEARRAGGWSSRTALPLP